ncbi:hypothetical protein EJB05_06695, partial [Eragrostis curvula]
MAAPPPCRAAALEYEPESSCWWGGSVPSTTLRLDRSMVPSPPRASSPDYTPSSTFRDAMSEEEYTPASPEYTPVSRSSWRAGSPVYTPATPTISEASADYTPASVTRVQAGEPFLDAGVTGLHPVIPDDPRGLSRLHAGFTRVHAGEHFLEGRVTDYTPASPEYTLVSNRWRARSPDYTPSSREFSPTYSPTTPPLSPVVSDAESRTSLPRRRHHPYQRGGASTCAMRACGISRVQGRLPDTATWKTLADNLGPFRDATRVTVGDGAFASFWFDLRDGNQPLATDYPALFSHATRPHISVRSAFEGNILLLPLRNRLTTVASLELEALQLRLQDFLPDPLASDQRFMRQSSAPFTTKAAYLLRFHGLPPDQFADNIWKSYAASRCLIFLWTLHKERLRTRDFLFRHLWRDSNFCPFFCQQPETSKHLFLACPRLSAFWGAAGIPGSTLAALQSIEQLWDITQSPWAPLPAKVRSTVITAALWSIWKSRNAKVFDNVVQPNATILANCASDINLWA